MINCGIIRGEGVSYEITRVHSIRSLGKTLKTVFQIFQIEMPFYKTTCPKKRIFRIPEFHWLLFRRGQNRVSFFILNNVLISSEI